MPRLPKRNVSPRAAGRKTSSAGLKLWSSKKLKNQINMQIRSDYGGKNPSAVLMREIIAMAPILDSQLLSTQLENIVAFVITKNRNMIKGCRSRVGPKVEELYRRATNR